MLSSMKKQTSQKEKNMKQIWNPIFPLNEYVPDGEPHVFGDRVYLFGSHDKEGGEEYCMLDYVCYSAPVTDLTEWRYEGVIYSPSQDPAYSENRKYIYAPDVVQGNDGRYYLYYCLLGDYDISVAVCDTPAGRYEYHGLVQNPDGSKFHRFLPADPAVMNDGGTIRLYYGWSLAFPEGQAEAAGMSAEQLEEIMTQLQVELFRRTREEVLAEPEGLMGANCVTLQDDMLTIASEPVRIVPGQLRAAGTDFEGHAFYEGSSIRKIGDTYYFIYSCQKNNQLCYATSLYPDRDFHYRGVIISNCDVEYEGREEKDAVNLAGTNHGSIEKINGKWYVFYHRLTHGSDYSRQACAEEIRILPDGSIPQVEVTTLGLNGKALEARGSYPAAIACQITNGRMPNIQFERVKIISGLPCVTHEGDERFITGIIDGTIVGYKYFSFEGSVQLTLTMRGTAEGMIIMSDGNDKLGSLSIHPITEWTDCAVPLRADGIKPLFLRYQGNGEMDLKDIHFEAIKS